MGKEVTSHVVTVVEHIEDKTFNILDAQANYDAEKTTEGCLGRPSSQAPLENQGGWPQSKNRQPSLAQTVSVCT